jgi:hypothetical protein
VSSGRSFKVTTPGSANPFGLLDLAASGGATINSGEATQDRWAINVVNTDATNTILVGRTGVPVIPLGPGVAYRFEGCCYRDVTINDQGNAVVVAIDGSDTIEERFRVRPHGG